VHVSWRVAAFKDTWRNQRRRKDAMWRARVRRPLILNDRTFPCDVIRCEHSPPQNRLTVLHGAG
jgi:hypothetical protein